MSRLHMHVCIILWFDMQHIYMRGFASFSKNECNMSLVYLSCLSHADELLTYLSPIVSVVSIGLLRSITGTI